MRSGPQVGSAWLFNLYRLLLSGPEIPHVENLVLTKVIFTEIDSFVYGMLP